MNIRQTGIILSVLIAVGLTSSAYAALEVTSGTLNLTVERGQTVTFDQYPDVFWIQTTEELMTTNNRCEGDCSLITIPEHTELTQLNQLTIVPVTVTVPLDAELKTHNAVLKACEPIQEATGGTYQSNSETCVGKVTNLTIIEELPVYAGFTHAELHAWIKATYKDPFFEANPEATIDDWKASDIYQNTVIPTHQDWHINYA